MKIENQTAVIGLLIGFSLGLLSSWSVNINKENNAIKQIEFYEERIDSLTNVMNYKDTTYSSIDTIVMNYDWGKEEVYIYEYN